MRSPQRENADKDNAPPLTAEARIATAGDVGGARDRRRLVASGCDGDWSVSPAPPLPFSLAQPTVPLLVARSDAEVCPGESCACDTSFSGGSCAGRCNGGYTRGCVGPCSSSCDCDAPARGCGGCDEDCVRVASSCDANCKFNTAVPVSPALVESTVPQSSSLVGRVPWMARLTLRPAPVQLEC